MDATSAKVHRVQCTCGNVIRKEIRLNIMNREDQTKVRRAKQKENEKELVRINKEAKKGRYVIWSVCGIAFLAMS